MVGWLKILGLVLLSGGALTAGPIGAGGDLGHAGHPA